MENISSYVEKAKKQEKELFGGTVSGRYRQFKEENDKHGEIKRAVPIYNLEFVTSSIYLNDMKLQELQFYKKQLGLLNYLKQCHRIKAMNFRLTELDKDYDNNKGSYVKKHNEFVEKADLLRYKRMLIFSRENKIFGEIVPDEHRTIRQKEDFRGLIMDIYPVYSEEYLKAVKSELASQLIRTYNPIKFYSLLCRLDEIEQIQKESKSYHYKKH